MSNVTYNATACNVATPPDACLGLRTSVNLGHWFGFRGLALIGCQIPFLIPHVVMACLMMLLVVLVLLQGVTIEAVSPVFLVLTAVFAIHILPMHAGIPSRLLPFDFNAMMIIIMLAMVLAGFVGLRMQKQLWPFKSFETETADKLVLLAWRVIGFCCLLAMVGEFPLIAMIKKGYLVADNGTPSEDSGHNMYDGGRWHAVGRILTFGAPAAVAVGLIMALRGGSTSYKELVSETTKPVVATMPDRSCASARDQCTRWGCG